MSERIDISEPLRDICRRLNLEPEFVAALLINPVAVTATVYEKNENGSKFLVDESAALAVREFKVTT